MRSTRDEQLALEASLDGVAMGPRVSRRGLLGGVAAMTVAVPVLSGAAAAPAAARSMGVRAASQAPGFVFSVQERDRRWAAVRGGMGEPYNLDAVVAGTFSEEIGDYLVPVFNAWADSAATGPVVFPRSASEPVYLILPDGDTAVTNALVGGLDSWTADGRLVISADDAVAGVVSRLQALGATRVGLAELTNLRVAPQGSVPWKTFEALRAGLPDVEWIEIERWKLDHPAMGPLAAAAMVKGPEELEVVRRCVSAGEHAIDAIHRAARLGAETVADLWQAGYLAMFGDTGEPPIRLSIALDDPGNAGYARALGA